MDYWRRSILSHILARGDVIFGFLCERHFRKNSDRDGQGKAAMRMPNCIYFSFHIPPQQWRKNILWKVNTVGRTVNCGGVGMGKVFFIAFLLTVMLLPIYTIHSRFSISGCLLNHERSIPRVGTFRQYFNSHTKLFKKSMRAKDLNQLIFYYGKHTHTHKHSYIYTLT